MWSVVVTDAWTQEIISSAGLRGVDEAVADLQNLVTHVPVVETSVDEGTYCLEDGLQ